MANKPFLADGLVPECECLVSLTLGVRLWPFRCASSCVCVCVCVRARLSDVRCTLEGCVMAVRSVSGAVVHYTGHPQACRRQLPKHTTTHTWLKHTQDTHGSSTQQDTHIHTQMSPMLSSLDFGNPPTKRKSDGTYDSLAADSPSIHAMSSAGALTAHTLGAGCSKRQCLPPVPNVTQPDQVCVRIDFQPNIGGLSAARVPDSFGCALLFV